MKRRQQVKTADKKIIISVGATVFVTLIIIVFLASFPWRATKIQVFEIHPPEDYVLVTSDSHLELVEELLQESENLIEIEAEDFDKLSCTNAYLWVRLKETNPQNGVNVVYLGKTSTSKAFHYAQENFYWAGNYQVPGELTYEISENQLKVPTVRNFGGFLVIFLVGGSLFSGILGALAATTASLILRFLSWKRNR